MNYIQQWIIEDTINTIHDLEQKLFYKVEAVISKDGDTERAIKLQKIGELLRQAEDLLSKIV